jgi:hypothetical protein
LRARVRVCAHACCCRHSNDGDVEPDGAVRWAAALRPYQCWISATWCGRLCVLFRLMYCNAWHGWCNHCQCYSLLKESCGLQMSSARRTAASSSFLDPVRACVCMCVCVFVCVCVDFYRLSSKKLQDMGWNLTFLAQLALSGHCRQSQLPLAHFRSWPPTCDAGPWAGSAKGVSGGCGVLYGRRHHSWRLGCDG